MITVVCGRAETQCEALELNYLEGPRPCRPRVLQFDHYSSLTCWRNDVLLTEGSPGFRSLLITTEMVRSVTCIRVVDWPAVVGTIQPVGETMDYSVRPKPWRRT